MSNLVRVSFTMIIPPKGQMRARHMARAIGEGKVFSTTYTDKKQTQENRRLEALLMENRPEKPFKGPIMLGINAYLPIPKSMPKRQRETALSGDLRPIKKPDLDNLFKQLKDCMTGIFWEDDRQVVGYLASGKFYGDPARWEVRLIVDGDLN